MMSKIISFIKKNWLILTIVLIITYLFLRPYQSFVSLPESNQIRQAGSSVDNDYKGYQEESSQIMAVGAPVADSMAKSTPNSLPVSSQRMVVNNSTLSLLVTNVKKTQNDIIKKTNSLGGYMVESQLTSPEEIDSGILTIRVPTDKLDETLEYIRSQGVRVVSENLLGTDITDQYTDIQARLETLEKTKAKFDEILDKAVNIQDILDVQRQIIYIQDQIDQIKGQKQLLEKSSQTSKITIYLSSDEYSLPYAPSAPWRPEVIFKMAVRSLVSTFRSIGSIVIWLIVFTPVWGTILVISFIFKKIKSKKKNKPVQA